MIKLLSSLPGFEIIGMTLGLDNGMVYREQKVVHALDLHHIRRKKNVREQTKVFKMRERNTWK
jgi:hypothetical protein